MKTLGGEALVQTLRQPPGKPVSLPDEHASRTYGWEAAEAKATFAANRRRLDDLQYKLYADGRYALLVVLQAIDAGGKDGTIRHVMSAFSPQGFVVTSFKTPSAEELKHDFLWRIHKRVPARGEIGVFNRSHYEDVLIARVDKLVSRPVWMQRFTHINHFEHMLTENGVRVVKLFLHISKAEQRKRFEARLKEPRKHWKFGPEDLEKRKQWNAYRRAFEDALTRCGTHWAPWYVVPADHKWFRNLAVSEILASELERLPLRFPPARFDPAKVSLV